MGQKVSPIGMRVGVIRDWDSRWYANKAEYGDLLNEDIKIRNLIEKEGKAANISRIEIERAGKKDVKIIVRCARPGALVGKAKDDEGNAASEEKIKTIRNKITKIVEKRVKASNDAVQSDTPVSVKIDVVQVGNPDLDARLVAKRICDDLEQRKSFRIVQKKAIQTTMRAGAKGIKTQAKGRLGGAEIARSEGYSRGVVPLHTLRQDIDYAWEEAQTTYGKLGVKVWICRGEVKPGEMVQEPEAPERKERNTRGRTPRKGAAGPRRPRAPKEVTDEAANTEASVPQEVAEVAEAVNDVVETAEGGEE